MRELEIVSEKRLNDSAEMNIAQHVNGNKDNSESDNSNQLVRHSPPKNSSSIFNCFRGNSTKSKVMVWASSTQNNSRSEIANQNQIENSQNISCPIAVGPLGNEELDEEATDNVIRK